MKKKIETVLFALIFIISASVLIIMLKDENRNEKADRSLTTVGYVYTVKEFNGKVALFSYGESLPFQILDCPLSSLPEAEANNIRIGINIVNEKQLQNIIEAYD